MILSPHETVLLTDVCQERQLRSHSEQDHLRIILYKMRATAATTEKHARAEGKSEPRKVSQDLAMTLKIQCSRRK